MKASYKIIPFSYERRLVEDSCRIGKKIPYVTIVWEVDITDLRSKINIYKKQNSSTLSITKYVLYCFIRSVQDSKDVQACKSWNNKLYLFDDIDVFFPIELANKTVDPKIIRSSNRKNISDLESEITSSKAKKQVVIEWYKKLFLNYPKFIRDTIYSFIMKNPVFRKRFFGTVFFSSPSYTADFKLTSYGIPSQSIAMCLGSKYSKTVTIDDVPKNREFISITTHADHSIIDGAELCRFINSMKKKIDNEINKLIK